MILSQLTPLLFTHAKCGHRWRLRPNLRPLVPLENCACMFKELFNPFKPNRSFHTYQSDQSISVLTAILFIFIHTLTFCKQTVKTLIRRHVLWRLIWVCTVCQCPTKRMLGLYGLSMIIQELAHLTMFGELSIYRACLEASKRVY